MQNNAKAPIIVQTHLTITDILDGDSIKVVSSSIKMNLKLDFMG